MNNPFYGQDRKELSGETSKKQKNDTNQYTAYYTAEDGTEVKKVTYKALTIVSRLTKN